MSRKEKFALWAYPETLKKVDMLYQKDNCRSRTEFIEKAILFYCGYITSDEYRQYLPNVVISTMQATLTSFENRMASLLFKMAVELAMNLHVTAATNEIDESTLTRLRGMCVDEVKRLHGSISLDDATKFQKE